MGSVVDSLKRLYKKIGGGKVKGPIAIDDLVDKIADQMSSGGSGSGGSSSDNKLFFVTFQGQMGRPDSLTCDKTFQEILEAYNNEKAIVFVTPDPSYIWTVFPAFTSGPIVPTGFFAYSIWDGNDTAIYVTKLVIDNSDTIFVDDLQVSCQKL